MNTREGFTLFPTLWAQNDRLSLRARGLLGLLFSYPPGHSFTLTVLARENPEGRTAIRTALAQLESHGYLSSSQTPTGSHVTGTAADYTLTDPDQGKELTSYE